MPVVFLVLSAAFAQFDFDLVKAAQSLGAGGPVIWRRIILPQVGYNVLVAALLAFLTSLDEVVIAMVISMGDNTTLPKVMFTSLRDKIDPAVAVVSTILLFVATSAILFLQIRFRKRNTLGV